MTNIYAKLNLEKLLKQQPIIKLLIYQKSIIVAFETI